ncbi:ArnT family glycosyltransferase [Mongoliimonas terrestris]|uniref:ArnT family glycosyltransferase n=1 Tax=Mongoliimonas terrestris TaxID=1709001 RepID=UPI0009499FA1|nr:glycosyltransferase family 39 protein [Mongoliimonas terrestris]
MESRPLVDRLATPVAVVLFWLLHGVVYTVLLGGLYPTIAHVDANSLDTMQRALAPAYQVNNPPSWEWMLWAVQRVVGEGAFSHLVLRYGLMGAIGVLMYGLVRHWTGRRLDAAAASYGLHGFYWFAWYMHEGMTHTITLVVAILAFLAVVVRHLERPTLESAVGIGLAMGFGLLAKFNFAMLIGATLIAFLADAKLRPRLVDARLLVSVLVATAIAAPVAIAVGALGGDIARMTAGQLAGDEPDHLTRAVVGAVRYAASFGLFLLPWGLVAAYAWWTGRGVEAPSPSTREALAARLLRSLIVTGIPAGLVAVVVFGIASTSERYIFPLALPIVLAFHVTVARRIAPRRLVGAFATVGAIVLVVALVLRTAAAFTGGYPEARENKRLDPYDRLAEALRADGLADAFFVTRDRYEAGNLMTALPTAQAAGLVTHRLRQSMSYPPDGRCLLFFKGRFETADRPPGEIRPPAAIAERMPPGATVETIRVPWHPTLLGPDRTGVFHLVDVGTDAPLCREVFGDKVLAITDR